MWTIERKDEEDEEEEEEDKEEEEEEEMEYEVRGKKIFFFSFGGGKMAKVRNAIFAELCAKMKQKC